MWVQSMALQDFRNFQSLHTHLKNGINILHGHNAQGKTNFLEAVYFCATGRSQRAGNDRELVRFGLTEAHLQATVCYDAPDNTRVIDVHLKKDEGRKGIAIDHIPIKKLNELYGILPVVVFSPEDLRLLKAGPAERRAFMDMELCQLNPVYYHALRQYHHALRQRNHLLKAIPKNRGLADTVFVWNEQLCEFGRDIMAARGAFTEQINAFAQDLHGKMTDGTERLVVTYKPCIADPAMYAEKLNRSLERDIVLGSTAVGVHKDDLQFTINGTDARVYGSQGQQRTAALAAKLAEIAIFRERMAIWPVLLLDDVLSELDTRRQSFLLANIGHLQTVLTCTGVEDVLKKYDGDLQIMRMVNGVCTVE